MKVTGKGRHRWWMVKSRVDVWEEPSTGPDSGVWEVRYNEKSRMVIVPGQYLKLA